jgi:hypothetical protein
MLLISSLHDRRDPMAENPENPKSTDATKDEVKKVRTDAATVEGADDVAGHVQPPPDFTFENNSR